MQVAFNNFIIVGNMMLSIVGNMMFIIVGNMMFIIVGNMMFIIVGIITSNYSTIWCTYDVDVPFHHRFFGDVASKKNARTLALRTAFWHVAGGTQFLDRKHRLGGSILHYMHKWRFCAKNGWVLINTWWLIPLSKWVITPVINGISRVNPLITGVITHLLSGMSHQVCF